MNIAFYVLVGVTIVSWILWAAAWDNTNQRARRNDTRANNLEAAAERLKASAIFDQNLINSLSLDRNQMLAKLYPLTTIEAGPYPSPKSTKAVNSLHSSELIDIITAREADDLERASAAWFRIKDKLVVDLSLKPDGHGPLLSASKGVVASKALENVVGNLGGEDWTTVERWLDDHPGQFDKLNGELGTE